MLLGIDIGGTKCAVVCGHEVNGALTVTGKTRVETREHPQPMDMLARLAAEAKVLLAGSTPEAIGISCGGPLSSRSGTLLSPPNLPGWNEVPVAPYLQQALGAPARLENDANACALAEWRYGAGAGCQNFVFLTFGTGLGAGLILNGALYRGRQDMAGELGHWRMAEYGPAGYGKAGSLEGFCSGGGIAQLARSNILAAVQQGNAHPLAHKLNELNAKEVFNLARAGDGPCRQTVETVGRTFGAALALVIDLLNPEVIVAGSIFSRDYDLLYPLAMEVVGQESLPHSALHCRVLPSALGDAIGDIAALALAAQG